MLIVNADDLGLSAESVINTAQCYEAGSVTSASVMVFMDKSQEASSWARTAGIETGLHLNLTERFSSTKLSERLRDCHRSVTNYYQTGVSSLLFNPFLKKEIDYVFKAQYDEYCRLFDAEPLKIDGHHHMHLSMNIMMSSLIRKGTAVRRNFSFKPTEKNFFNRTYRRMIDAWLSRRFICTDSFFSIKPLEDLQRLRTIAQLSLSSNVELAVHPAARSEYSFLLGSQFHSLIEGIPLGAFSQIMN